MKTVKISEDVIKEAYGRSSMHRMILDELAPDFIRELKTKAEINNKLRYITVEPGTILIRNASGAVYMIVKRANDAFRVIALGNAYMWSCVIKGNNGATNLYELREALSASNAKLKDFTVFKPIDINNILAGYLTHRPTIYPINE